MKRSPSHILEDESKLALRKRLIPLGWIVRDRDKPDYGVDLEVEIVEKGEVTNKILWLQMKASERISGKPIYPMETKHLKYYEGCRFPVLILYWDKATDTFYWRFAQKFIKEELSVRKPMWRNQGSASVSFPPDSKLDDVEALNSIATDGYLYLVQMMRVAGQGSAQYWLPGIPKHAADEA